MKTCLKCPFRGAGFSMIQNVVSREKKNIKGKVGIIPLLFILLISVSPCFSQVAEDSTRSVRSEAKSPRTAILRSALIPGWGQWYNGKKIKAILVLGGELALAGNAVYFNQLAVSSANEYDQEYYRENRRLYIWWLAAAHILNIIDALVDAHLSDFDTGPDLSAHGSFGGALLIGIAWPLRTGRFKY